MTKKKIVDKVKEIAEKLTSADAKKAVPGVDAPSWVAHIAVLTGVLAALTGFLTVRATKLTNNAIYESNQAILSQTQASDSWSEYQANSIKAHMVEMELLPSHHASADERASLLKMQDDFRKRQPENREAAANNTKERESHLRIGMNELEQKDLLGYASMVAQLGIALASVAALVHRRAAFYAAIAASIVATGITAYVFLWGFIAG